MDVFYMTLVLFILAVMSIVGYMVYSKVNTQLQAVTIGDTDLSVPKGIWSDTQNRYVGIFDGLFATVLVLMWLLALFLASQIDTSPVFFFVSFIVYGVLVLFAAVVGNSYYEIATAVGIVSYAEDFTIIPMVMNYYAHLMVIIGLSVGFVMWSKGNAQ